jgi:hypothetical protein
MPIEILDRTHYARTKTRLFIGAHGIDEQGLQPELEARMHTIMWQTHLCTSFRQAQLHMTPSLLGLLRQSRSSEHQYRPPKERTEGWWLLE